MAKISVIVPTYNMGIFCPEAVNSTLANDFDDFELIVVNDGSTDTTETLLDSFINYHCFVTLALCCYSWA